MSEEDECQVCNKASSPDLKLVKCKQCSTVVHTLCYGIQSSSSSSLRAFTCDLCKAKLEHLASCAICGSRFSAPCRTVDEEITRRFRDSVKQEFEERRVTRSNRTRTSSLQLDDDHGTDESGLMFAHNLCVLLHKEFRLSEKLDRVVCVDEENASLPRKYLGKCRVCDEQGTFLVKCMNPKCRKMAHPTCAVNDWTRCEWQVEDRFLMQFGKLEVFCSKTCNSKYSAPEKPKSSKANSKNEESSGESESDASMDESEDNSSFEEDSQSDDESNSDGDENLPESSFKIFSITKPRAQLYDPKKALDGFPLVLPSESIETALKRRGAYEESYSCLTEYFDELANKLNYENIKNLIRFLRAPETPAAPAIRSCIITKSVVGIGQNEEIMKNLSALLNANKIPYSFVSLSRLLNCTNSQMNSFLNSLVEQLVARSKFKASGTFKSQSPVEKMKTLNSWIIDGTSSCAPRVFICFMDFESVSPSTLDFLIVFLEQGFPGVLSVGFLLKSSLEFLKGNFLKRTLRKMDLKLFHLEPRLEYAHLQLKDLFSGSALQVFPLLFGPKVLSPIFEAFLEDNMSLDIVLHGVRFVLLQHYARTPLSFLWNPKLFELEAGGIFSYCKNSLKLLSDKEFQDSCKKIQSLQRVECSKDSVARYVTNLVRFRKNWKPAFDLIFASYNSVFAENQSISWLDAYESVIYSRKNDFALFSKIVKQSGKEVLVKLANICLEYVPEKFGSLKEADFLKSKLADLLEKLESFQDRSMIAKEDFSDLAEISSKGPLKGSKRRNLLKPKSVENPISNLQDELLHVYNSLYELCLSSVTSMPLHEIIYNNEGNNLKNSIYGDIHSATINGLQNPEILPGRELDCLVMKSCFSLPYDFSLNDEPLSKLMYDMLKSNLFNEQDNFSEQEIKSRFLQSLQDFHLLGLPSLSSRSSF